MIERPVGFAVFCYNGTTFNREQTVLKVKVSSVSSTETARKFQRIIALSDCS